MTRNEIEARLNALRQLLCGTDYKALKASEGSPGDDWEVVRARRQAWRDEINGLEPLLEAVPGEGLGDAAN